MFIVLFATIIGFVMLFVKFKEYRENKDSLRRTLSDKKFDRYDFYHIFIGLYAIFILAGVASAIYGFYMNDVNTAAMGIVIALLFSGEALNVKDKYSLYYNDTSFISKGKSIRYKSIREFERIKNMPIAYIKVVTTNGEKYPVSPKSYKIILEKYELAKKK